MVATSSTMVELGSPAPDFDLPDPSGTRHTLADFADAPVLVVMFLCNHCPYVRLIREALASLTGELMDRGVAVVAISSNDADAYPDDSPEAMAREADQFGYRFPYLYDADQVVAKAYRAACTPDFFVYDRDRRLVYRGQFDDARPSLGKVPTGADLRAAVQAALADDPPLDEQFPSMGCNIKWRPGNEPEYFAS